MTRVAYLFPAFPVFHQTFVLWEVLGLRRNGIFPTIYSLRHGTVQQQPEAIELAREVRYLPGMFSGEVRRANWRRLRADRRRYCRLYLEVVRAWRTGAVRESIGGNAQVSAYDRVRGWYNSQPFLYLLKSLMLVPTAVLLADWLERDGITHLHVHWASYPATVAYVVHHLTGMPFSISAHAYDIYMVPRMLPAKVRAARFVVTCAQANASFLKRLAGQEVADKILVSYHGVDVSRFTAADERRSDDALTIASCGQLEHYKGMHHLIDACATLRRQGRAVRCRIVGEGPQRARLQEQIARLGLNEVVQLLGARPHAEFASLLRTADVFVLASEMVGKFGRRDVIANVIVEAMAAGLPVVASHVPGVEELVDNGVNGYLVPPNQSDQLAAAIARLADHPVDRHRFGEAARRRVLRDFDNSRNVRRLADLFVEPATESTPAAAVG
ncbi:MAG TPA: glycosyltransferase family 4 protein [Candidatus Kryptonia bacterium]|nr:glycosyltransferase family 4 protein [Candidatus Kryptonia bacterium]